MIESVHQQQEAATTETYPKKKTLNIKFMVVGLIAVIVVLGIVFFGMRDTSGPLEISQGFVMDVKKGDYSSAKKSFSTDAKSTYTDLDLKRLKEKFSSGVAYTAQNNLTMTGDNAVQIVEHTGIDGKTTRHMIYLEKDFWGWKIISLN